MSSSTKNKSLLVQLSVACQKHRVQHHSHPNGEDEHSEECQKDLKALSVVIPKVEAEYLRSTEIAHLCDFYNDAINGGFCPHAPKLFRTGIDDSFKRIVALMENLVAKRVLQASIKSDYIVDKLCSTVARLLSFEANLVDSISKDLVNLCMDLSTVQEAKLLETNDTLRVVLFSETVGGSDYFIEIPNAEAAHALQVAGIKLVHEFALHHVNDRLGDSFDSSRPRHNVDALWRSDNMATLLASLRQVLLSPLPQSTKMATFALRARSCAFQLLESIVAQWEQFGISMHRDETALLISRAVHWFFSCSERDDEIRMQLAAVLNRLVRNAVLFVSPMKGGVNTLSSRSQALLSLLDCIPNMERCALMDQGLDADLCYTLLTTIGVFIKEDVALLETAMHHCTTNSIFPQMFGLLSTSSTPIRGAVVQILHSFLEVNGCQRVILASACRFAEHSIGPPQQMNPSQANRKPLKTQNRTPPGSTRRKRVAGGTNRSPRKLVLEPSPKRRRTSRATDTTPASEVAEAATPMPAATPSKCSPSLADSLRLFFFQSIQNSRAVMSLCRERSSGSNPASQHNLRHRLQGCTSALFLLLPELIQEPENCISEVVAELADALSLVSAAIAAAWQECAHNRNEPEEKLIQHTEELVDAGLMCHTSLLRSSRRGVLESLAEFLINCSRCVWDALTCYPSVAKSNTPWKGCCRQCCCMMSFLNIRETDSTMCTCLARLRGESHVPENSVVVSGWPLEVKLVAFAFASPPLESPLTSKTAETELQRACRPSIKKCEEIMRRLLSGTDVSLFAVAFLALLPSLVLSWTRELARQIKEEEFSREKIFQASCTAFPHKALLKIVGKKDASLELRKGAILGVHHFRSLIRATEWKADTSTRIATCAPQLTFFFSLCASSLADQSHREPHHGLSALDRELRFSLLSMSFISEDAMPPDDRIQKWRIVKCAVLQESPAELQSMPKSQSEPEDTTFNLPEILTYMISAPFADSDYTTRLTLSRELGEFLMFHGGHVLQAMFGGDDRSYRGTEGNSETGDLIMAQLFHQIDLLLVSYGRMPRSQMPSTFTTPSNPDASQSIEPLEVEYQYTALRTLASLCQFAKYNDPQGRVLLENSLLRMVRIWATLDHSGGGNEVNGARASLSSLSFLEIRRLSSICDLTYLSSGTSQRRLLPLLVCEVLEPAAASLQIDSGRKALGQDLRQRQDRLLYAFLESFVLTDLSEITTLDANDSRLQHMRPNLGSPFLVANFLDECLRFAIPLMVVEKDYDSMRLAAGFKLFVLGLHTSSSSNRSKDIILGMSIRTRMTRASGTKKTRISLEEHTKNLCLQSEMIEHILPRLLMGDYNDRSQVVFFLEVALQSEMSLQKLVAKSDRILLKGLIWELGGWTHVGKSAIQAVEMAALARESSLREEQNTEQSDSTMIASQWVSSHFMFLLVNIVQTKWREKSLDDKIKALKSLNLMLAFLLPSEAPQFLTQLVATVSMAASLEIPLSAPSFDRVKFWLLRKLAAQNLASYSKTLLNGHVEMIGRNLASIVVSLFPILVHNEDEDEDTEDAAIERIRTEAGRVAAGIFDMFTSKKVGRELAHFFNEVPFLPTTPLLERTRENLKRNGVVFDNLAVLSRSETTQRVLSGRDSMTSDGGTNEKEGRLDRLNERLLPLLQKRLRIVRPLVSHESASVRLRTLNHLTDLLRANRVLFYRLLDKESSTATSLTVYYPNVEYEGNGGSIATLVQALLKRASSENNKKLKAALGTCLGEVAAIDPHRVGRMSTSSDWYQNKATNSTDDGKSWQLSQPPWRSSIHKYALHLLTMQLANALKAASNSAELHKIAFTIQQMLVILEKLPKDNTMHVENRDVQIKISGGKKDPMSGWLRNELKEAGALDILEPYWATSFSEIDSKIQRNPKHQPPFFQNSDTYFSWISRWCRYMILRSSENSRCEWRGFLYACRTAVRSLAGIVISEFILPVLVLERLCFGSPDDEAVILKELQDVFDTTMDTGLSSGDAVQMSFNERQKAVNAAFLLVDILKQWGETEVESKHNGKKHAGSQASISIASGSWNASRCMEKITDMLLSVSLDAMSKSAVSMGMHARALLCLETKARADLAASVYDTTKAASVAKGGGSGTKVSARHGLGSPLLNGIDLRGLKDVLGKLDDYPTIRAVNGKSGSPLYDNDSIRERESRSDWVGALSDYERALQSQTNASSRSRLQHAYLHCLLQIGQYESVLNQVDGIIHRAKATSTSVGEEDINRAIPMGIDAAWRLGRWSVLDSLVKEYDSREWGGHSPVDFQLAVGKAMLGLHRQSKQEVDSALGVARDAVMAKLSTFARDSYERAYPSLVNLHCLREIEDASVLLNSHGAVPGLGWGNLSDMANSDDVGGWAWDCRLEIASSTDSSRITDVRLALARLAGDSRLEGKLLFVMGKKARKNALLDVASTCFAQSHAVFAGLSRTDPYGNKSIEWIGDIQMQFAKLQYQTGQSGSALRILGVEDLTGWSKLSHDEVQLKAAATLQAITGSPTPRADKSVFQDMAKRLLKSTRWIADGGLKAVPEVMERFRVTNQLWPKWEKSHFEFGKYVDSILDSRISGVGQHEGWSADDNFIRHYALTEDMNCQNYLLMAVEQYLEALKISDKHVYQALPRLLSLWFEYTSVQRNASKRGSKARRQGEESPLNVSSDPSGFLRRKQDEANEMFQKSASSISSSMFYTATPQLISRVCHPNGDTALAVQALLTRILTKFPGQAMWELAWVRNSLDKKRSNIGHQIFNSAQKSILGWASSDRRGESKRKIFEKNQKILAASQSFVKYLIDIAKYTPKDERARSFKLSKWRGEVDLSDFIPPVQTALASPFDSTRHGRDPFPRFRAMHESVQIMSSKAKPKRVKFYVIPGGSRSTDSHAKPGSGDVGELHFLLKNEVKGDLRKDARVQDLNNVINRLVVNSGKGRRQRRLQLRTFAVTCLSEDCGSVEWVPNTDSFRNLASRSYNPQAATYSAKRRGKRIANFGDPNLKKNYESCQGHFFKHGDLTSAARLFETHFLNAFPPLFYWWFVQTFMDPHAWYEARTNFTYSSAVWSAVGHVIGLGDRHSENLLIDTSSGSCVHVDFDCIFDKGLTLPKPEIIPFRLTSNMVDAFGPVGADGMYAESLKAAMSVLRDNRDTLLSVLEPFVKDPIIDWKKNSSSQRQSGSAGVRDTKQAKRSIKVIDERLRGIYNLHNPNFKKVKRTDQVAVDNDEEMAQIVPLSVDGQVHKMISEATSHENLIQLYIGWMPWI